MDVKIASDWKEILSEEFEKPYFRELTDFVRQEYASRRIFPRGSNIFRAFDKCPFDKLKVVIIGQDPYHGEGQANGLCFSVADGVPFPPSLQNIFQEVADDTGSPIVYRNPSYQASDTVHHRLADSHERQPRPLGRTGRAATQCRADGPGARSGLPRRTRLGNFHRCGRAGHRTAQARHRLHAVGKLRPAQRRHRRSPAQLHPQSRPSLPAVGLPGIFRQQTLFPGQRISAKHRKGTDFVVSIITSKT